VADTKLKMDVPKVLREFKRSFSLAQKKLDSVVLTDSNRYTPFVTGELRDSGTTGTEIGSGEIRWVAPYAKKQYYGKGQKTTAFNPLAAGQWFEVAKAAHKTQWIKAAKQIAGKR
jgi:hypothetical protein